MAKVAKNRRPSYRTHVKPRLDDIRLLVAEGALDTTIAENLGIARSTFYKWKAMYPELAEALAAGEALANAKVQHALYIRAIGQTVTEVEEFRDESGRAYLRKRTKYIPGDARAQIFWLTNRCPDRWSINPSPMPAATPTNDVSAARDKLIQLITRRLKKDSDDG